MVGAGGSVGLGLYGTHDEEGISSMSFGLVGTEGKLYLNNNDGEWRSWPLEDGEHVEEPIPGLDGSWAWDVVYRESFVTAANHLVELLDGTARNHLTGVEATRSLEVMSGSTSPTTPAARCPCRWRGRSGR